jgi:hypothetical protein
VTGVRVRWLLWLSTRHRVARMGIGWRFLGRHFVAGVRVRWFGFRRHLVSRVRVRRLLGRHLVAGMGVGLLGPSWRGERRRDEKQQSPAHACAPSSGRTLTTRIMPACM